MLLLIVLFTAVPRSSQGQSQLPRTCFSGNNSESEWARGKCHFMEGRTGWERRFSEQEHQVMSRTKVLSKALIVLSLSCHNSCSGGSVGALCNDPSYSSCSINSWYSLASSYFYFSKTEGVLKPQMFTKKPRFVSAIVQFFVGGVGLLCVFSC